MLQACGNDSWELPMKNLVYFSCFINVSTTMRILFESTNPFKLSDMSERERHDIFFQNNTNVKCHSVLFLKYIATFKAFCDYQIFTCIIPCFSSIISVLNVWDDLEYLQNPSYLCKHSGSEHIKNTKLCPSNFWR